MAHNLPSIDSLGGKVHETDAAQGNGTGPGGRTPTLESMVFEDRSALSESLSKRRGSDTLSIGIPNGASGPRNRPSLGQNSLQATPMATPRPGDGAGGAGLRRGGTIKANPPGKSHPHRQHIAASNSALVADDSDDDDKGYEAEGDPETELEQSPRVTVHRKNGATVNPPSSGQRGQHSPSTSSTQSRSTAKGQNMDTHVSMPHIDGHVPGRQPVRNHHHRSDTTDSIASSRREKENMKPFPTPGAKEQRNPFEEEKSFEESRLDQSEAKEKHWKRWGPYLSERQWVRTCLFFRKHSDDGLRCCFELLGYCQRGLLGQWRRVDFFPSRSCSLACIPLGRRRHRWDFR